ncbi:MAG: ribonuclease E/G [Paracoccaceae bacterium]
MKGRVIALDHVNGRAAAALLVDGKLHDFLIDPTGGQPAPGTLFRAICNRPLKGQGGMMLRLPDGTGFLRQGKNLRPGQQILIQVTGYGEDQKAVPVTQKIVFKSRYIIVTPGAPGINVSRRIRDEDEIIRLLEAVDGAALDNTDFGIIIRSQAEGADSDDIAQDVAATLSDAQTAMADAQAAPALILAGPGAHTIGWREWGEPDQLAQNDGSFEELGILDSIEELASAKVSLSLGASLYVEPTRALVAVDVNTGPDTSPAAGLKANLACARELPRQLRLRGLGGQIVLDLAPMPKKDRRQFENALRSAMRNDPVETALVGWTPLGHYELQRKRERLPLIEGA